MNLPLPIHPFPARMASEVALAQVEQLPSDAVVLDPMAGSGTVVRVAAESGRRALGFDLDPLAVLMARVWTSPVNPEEIVSEAEALCDRIALQSPRDVALDWIDDDPETTRFVDYWFAQPQQLVLRRLSRALSTMVGPIADALRLALSRTIITKDHGASLARDVSHSRPHRVRTDNDFPVAREFLRWARRLARRIAEQPPPGNATVALGDARRLSVIAAGSVDAVITSPPYLNAIDYLRGHRLSLVWLGYRVGALRDLRSTSIGAEHAPAPEADLQLAALLRKPLDPLAGLPSAQSRMIDRYVLDLHAMVTELYRVIRPGGRAVLVVGNSCVRGVFVKNAAAVIAAAEQVGFTLHDQSERELPPNRRYLPPPEARTPTDLEKRMRSETVLSFQR